MIAIFVPPNFALLMALIDWWLSSPVTLATVNAVLTFLVTLWVFHRTGLLYKKS